MARGRNVPGPGASIDPELPRALEAVIREVSADSFEDDLGVREDAWARKVRRDLDAKLASLRRQLRPEHSAENRITRVSAEIRALDRAALLVRLAALQQAPGVQIAHPSLSTLPTDELRLLVAELEATASTQEVPT